MSDDASPSEGNTTDQKDANAPSSKPSVLVDEGRKTEFAPLPYFLVWLALGTQSFGGGSVVLALIRRASVDTYGWVTEAEFVRDWALVQFAPGINIIAFIILIGRRVAGWRGILLALIGLLLPSAIVTVLLTALYTHFQNEKAVQAALRGVLPATVGLSLLTTFQLARPPPA